MLGKKQFMLFHIGFLFILLALFVFVSLRNSSIINVFVFSVVRSYRARSLHQQHPGLQLLQLHLNQPSPSFHRRKWGTDHLRPPGQKNSKPEQPDTPTTTTPHQTLPPSRLRSPRLWLPKLVLEGDQLHRQLLWHKN